MAISKGYETLMLRSETKQKFKETKEKLEKDLGIPLTISQALNLMCLRILSDSK